MATNSSTSLITQTFGVWTVIYEPSAVARSREFSNWLASVKGVAERAVCLIKSALESDEVPVNEKATDASAFKESPIPRQMRNLLRFVKEVYALGPSLFVIHIASQLLFVVLATISLYASNKLLDITSRCLEAEECRVSGIMYFLALEVINAYACIVLENYT